MSGSARGTGDPTEALKLGGNSANAELAAAERVDAVRPSRVRQDSLMASPSTSPDAWFMGWWATTIS